MKVSEKLKDTIAPKVDFDTGLPVQKLRRMLTEAENAPASELNLDEIKILGRQMRDKHLANQR